MDVEDLSSFSCFFECHSNSIKNWLPRDNLHYIYCHHFNFRTTMGNCMYLWTHQPFIQIATTFFSKSLNLSQFLLLTMLCFTLWCSHGVDKEDFVWVGPGEGRFSGIPDALQQSFTLLDQCKVSTMAPEPTASIYRYTPFQPHQLLETVSVEIFFETESGSIMPLIVF